MKRVQAERLESLDDYAIVETERPEPAAGEALIRSAACGVGYGEGRWALGRYQEKPPLPHTPGQEVSGIVAALGPDIEDLAVGDRVLARVWGGFSQFATAPVSAIEKIPAEMTFPEAAAFRVNYITALHALRDRAAIQPGERLLVMGAAGGVGIAAVQVGKLLGAEVIAVASTPEKRAFAERYGADMSLDSEPEGWRERLLAVAGGRKPDVILDPVCGPLSEDAFRSVNWRGRHLVVGFVGGPIPALRANLSLLKGAAMVGVDVRQFMEKEPALAAEHMRTLLSWVESGKLSPPLGRIFRFEQFAAALEYAHGGAGLGKTIVEICNS